MWKPRGQRGKKEKDRGYFQHLKHNRENEQVALLLLSPRSPSQVEKIQPQSLLVHHTEVIRIKLSFASRGFSVASAVGLCTWASKTQFSCLLFFQD